MSGWCASPSGLVLVSMLIIHEGQKFKTTNLCLSKHAEGYGDSLYIYFQLCIVFMLVYFHAEHMIYWAEYCKKNKISRMYIEEQFGFC